MLKRHFPETENYIENNLEVITEGRACWWGTINETGRYKFDNNH